MAEDSLTDTHRHLMQFMMSRRFVEERELKQKLEEYKQQHQYSEVLQQQKKVIPRDNQLEDFINSLNQCLSFMHFRIHKSKHNDKVFYTVINELDDDVSKLATRFSIDELQYFKTIVSKMATVKKRFGKRDANNLRPKGMSIESSDLFINSLVEEGWLEENADSSLGFGIRSKTELENLISSFSTEDEAEEAEEAEEEDE
ncbi:hypothetical protein ABK040_010403 [Willaertia magna]